MADFNRSLSLILIRPQQTTGLPDTDIAQAAKTPGLNGGYFFTRAGQVQLGGDERKLCLHTDELCLSPLQFL